MVILIIEWILDIDDTQIAVYVELGYARRSLTWRCMIGVKDGAVIS